MYLQKPEFDIGFYYKKDGSKPTQEFISGLTPKMKAKVIRTVDMLRLNGTELREPHSKHLDDGIFEIRVNVGSDTSRVLYFFMVNRKIILTHGFMKKTHKTPLSEIDRAKRYRSEYLSREENKQ